MKILFITPFYPYPLNMGGKTTLYNLLKRISAYHEVTVVSVFDAKTDTRSRTLENCCKKVIVIEKKDCNDRMLFLKATLPFTMSYVLKQRYEPAMREELMRSIQTGSFDIIFYVFTQSAIYMQENISPKQVLMEEDILYLKAKRQFYITPWHKPLEKLVSFMEYLKIRSFEIKAWNKADAIVTVTKSDEDKIKQANSHLNVSTIMRGVDYKYYEPQREERTLKDQILFLGAAQNSLNVDGINFFLKEIWPIILPKRPAAALKVVGNGFGDIFNKDRIKNVEEIGFTKDIRPHFNSSKVFVVPLLNGGGLRVKILEAMAMGCPIVTTSVGCEGIDLANGEDAFIRNDADGFADAVLTLLNNAELRRKFSKNAREKAMKTYAWDSIMEKFNLLAESLKKAKKT